VDYHLGVSGHRIFVMSGNKVLMLPFPPLRSPTSSSSTVTTDEPLFSHDKVRDDKSSRQWYEHEWDEWIIHQIPTRIRTVPGNLIYNDTVYLMLPDSPFPTLITVPLLPFGWPTMITNNGSNTISSSNPSSSVETKEFDLTNSVHPLPSSLVHTRSDIKVFTSVADGVLSSRALPSNHSDSAPLRFLPPRIDEAQFGDHFRQRSKDVCHDGGQSIIFDDKCWVLSGYVYDLLSERVSYFDLNTLKWHHGEPLKRKDIDISHVVIIVSHPHHHPHHQLLLMWKLYMHLHLSTMG
jgi:hypothetical protein